MRGAGGERPLKIVDDGQQFGDEQFLLRASPCLGFLAAAPLEVLKVGGHLVIVGPHKDWYWPVGHPDCNPDHEEYNWQLDQEVVSKWVQAIGSPPEKMQIVRSAEFGWDQDNWSFLVVAQKVSPAETSALSSEQVSPALQNTQTSSKRKVK